MSNVATSIRDAIHDRLKDLPNYGQYRTIRLAYMPQVQPDQIPILSVFIAAERLTPQGDGLSGPPVFVSETTIGVSIVRGFDEPATLDGSFDVDVDMVERRLLTDPTFFHFGEDSLFNSIPRMIRSRMFPQNGETYFSELRLEMTFMTDNLTYEPMITDDYKKTVLTARPLGHADAPAVTVELDSAQ